MFGVEYQKKKCTFTIESNIQPFVIDTFKFSSYFQSTYLVVIIVLWFYRYSIYYQHSTTWRHALTNWIIMVSLSHSIDLCACTFWQCITVGEINMILMQEQLQ